MDSETRRLIIGISGASGAIYGFRLLEMLAVIRESAGIETHLVMTPAAETTLAYETDLKVSDLAALADYHHANRDIGAPIASGSFRTDGMIIAPCSVKSAAEIANGTTSTLLTRAADVILKERKRLVCMVRETPLHSGHLRNLLALSDMGAIIAPPVPAFYSRPDSLDDMVTHTLGRVLDLFEIETDGLRRWRENDSGPLRRPGRSEAS